MQSRWTYMRSALGQSQEQLFSLLGVFDDKDVDECRPLQVYYQDMLHFGSAQLSSCLLYTQWTLILLVLRRFAISIVLIQTHPVEDMPTGKHNQR